MKVTLPALAALGVLGVYNSGFAQVNTLSGADESNNPTSNGSGVGTSLPSSAGPRLIAADIAQTNSLDLDSDVKNLVILIPDKRLRVLAA